MCASFVRPECAQPCLLFSLLKSSGGGGGGGGVLGIELTIQFFNLIDHSLPFMKLTV